MITVLDKKYYFLFFFKSLLCFFLIRKLCLTRPLPEIPNSWKGVLNNGKTGLFNPAHSVAYLGNILPSVKPQFSRGGNVFLSFLFNQDGAILLLAKFPRIFLSTLSF